MHATPLPNLQLMVGEYIRMSKLSHPEQNFSTQELLSIAEALKDAARWRYVRDSDYRVFPESKRMVLPVEFTKWLDEQMSKSTIAPAGTSAAPK